MSYTEMEARAAAKRMLRERKKVVPPLSSDDMQCDRFGLRFATLDTSYERRTVEWESEPYTGRKRLQDEPLSPRQIDPFTTEGADALRERSEHFAVCDRCRGEKKVICGSCQGSGREVCRSCRGSGNARSEKTGKVINCRSCRGSGNVSCSDCRRGLVSCPLCQGTGKLRRWLVIRRTRNNESRTLPHHEVLAGVDEHAAQVELVDQRVDGELSASGVERLLQQHEVGTTANELLRKSAAGERIIAQRLRVFELRVWRVQYALMSLRGQVRFVEGAKRPVQMTTKPVTAWWFATAVIFASAALAWTASAMAFLARDGLYYSNSAYFLPYVSASAVGCLAFAVSLAVASTGASRRVRAGVGVAGLAAIFVAMAVGGVTWWQSYPTADRVRDQLSRGNESAAAFEYAALERGGWSSPKTLADLRRSLDDVEVSRLTGDIETKLRRGEVDDARNAVASALERHPRRTELAALEKRALAAKVQQLQSEARACESRREQCRFEKLAEAYKLSPSATTKGALKAAVSEEMSRLEGQVAAVAKAKPAARHRVLTVAADRFQMLGGVAIDPTAPRKRAHELGREAERLSDAFVILGASIDDAEQFRGPLKKRSSTVWEFSSSGRALRALVVSPKQSVVTGYMTLQTRTNGGASSGSLGESEVVEFVKQLTGKPVAAKKLASSRDGIRHARFKHVRHEIEVGFDGQNLVEVRVGKSLF